MKTVIQHLRRAALLHERERPSDSQLLESFLTRREDVFFEALLRRHGPMVLGVCRRVLGNAHDAEDAFQATFLVFVRKADSLRSRELLANWLYGVAYRTAMKARAMNAKRRAKERQADTRKRTETPRHGAEEALLAQLDHELTRLPEKYRAAVVLCELQGTSRKEAARLLGVPEGTLSWRLAQAKKMLAKRLARHGTVLAVGAVTAALTEATGFAGLTPALRPSTLQAVLSAGAVPVKVLALTEGVMKAMLLSKLKITVCAAAVAIAASVGATGLTYRATAEEPRRAEYLARSTRNQASQPQADDVDSLRLEIEALRKELRSTRERVKVLEDEVRGSKKLPMKAGEKQATEFMDQLARGALKAPPDDQQLSKEALKRLLGSGQLDELTSKAVQKGLKSIAEKQAAGEKVRARKMQTDEPLGKALEALKKLQANPNDEQAAEAVERALKWLKGQQRQQKPRPETR